MTAVRRRVRTTLAARVTAGVGAVFVVCTGRTEKVPDITIVGALAVAAVIVALAYLGVEAATRGRGARRSPVGPALLFVGILLIVSAGVGFAARYLFVFQYADHYGHRTSVTRSDTCTVLREDHTECPGSEWYVDGERRTGTLIASWKVYDDTPGTRSRVPARVEANVVGDRAYSIPPEQDRTQLARWGGVPPWVLWVGLPVTAVALVLLYGVGWPRRTGR
jgi:hypothetical protein